MKRTDKRAVLRRIDIARKNAQRVVDGNARGSGRLGGAMAMEGWDGGYIAALDDVEAALRYGYPPDPRKYWREPDNEGSE